MSLEDGASDNERLLAAARDDSAELLLEVFEKENFDINYQDSLGNTALHYAASHGSTDTIVHLLEYDGCDVDLANRLEGATPLHLALKNLKDPDVRLYICENLLEAGANPTIKDKEGDTAWDLLGPEDEELRKLMRKSQAANSVSKGDIADDDDEDGDEGSASESE